MDKKNNVLIAYFSRAGKNYVKGEIIDIPVGNTKIVAEMIQKLTDGQMYEIITMKDYPVDYHEATKVAMEELRMRSRPEVIRKPSDLQGIEIVFLGFPNWWGTMPMAVFTFLEAYRWEGKRIIPFCTHEGSGLGNSVRDIKITCPEAEVDQGIAIYGHEVPSSEKEINKWVQEIEII